MIIAPIQSIHLVAMFACLFVLLFLLALLFRPTGSFLSFSRSVDGTTFTSSIKEKTVARALYAQARAKGKSTGLVR